MQASITVRYKFLENNLYSIWILNVLFKTKKTSIFLCHNCLSSYYLKISTAKLKILELIVSPANFYLEFL